ncbi:MAG: hypothetical protein PWQ10_281 [Patescibacteria group bacterium]|nr:hypothetical protein [Patescibacteria group bacterium]
MTKRPNNPPKFHHFIPKTYLKRWLDDSDLLYIYNKKSHNIKPSSINGQYFGKNHLNTITYPDHTKSYWIEELFADIEGIISPALNKIALTKHKLSKEITYDDRLFISLFVNVQYWRLPINKEVVAKMIKSGSFATIRSSMRDRKTGEKLADEVAKIIYDRISKDKFFEKTYPLMLALSKYLKEDAFEGLHDWHFYFQEPGFHITSDNPILYLNTPTADTVFMDFILPLSPSVLLISSKNPPKEISPKLSNSLNILQICHANQFVAGCNKGYLDAVSNLYNENFSNKPLEAVEQYMFNEIFNPS